MPLIKPGQPKKRTRRTVSGSSEVATPSRGDLERLFVSEVRLNILRLFLLKSAAKYHVREITRRVNAEINAVRRELDNLYEIGMLDRTPQKNRVVYSLRENFPGLFELLGLLVKDAGLGKAIISGRGLGEVKFAFISVPFLMGRQASTDDIDLLIVGQVPVRKISEIVKEEEKERGQEINYAVLSEREFTELKKRRDPLILTALLQPKVILTPNSHEYLTL